MRRIMLKKLRIENFKGCRECSIDFGNTTNIYGANASGKTTIADAWTWLLFDKDSSGATKFDIRPLDASGRTIDNVEILVEAVMEVDGATLTLQKVQKQNWVKKRGTDTVALQGNVNTYEIDGFPASEKEFKEKIVGIIPEELFKLLSDPRAFAALPWKKQREILLKFISEITDDDVLATDADGYAPIAEEVKAAGVEKAIEKARKAMAKLKDRQKELPARIDEASKSLVEVPELADMELQRNALNERLAEVQKQRDDIGEAYKAVNDIRGEIMQVKFDMSSIAQNAEEAVRRAKREARAAHDAATDREHALFDEKRRKESELKRLQERESKFREEREVIGKQYMAARSMSLDESEKACRYCGQVFPPERIEQIQSDFEKNKQEEITRLGAEGYRKKVEIDGIKQEIENLESEIETTKNDWNAAMQASGKAYEYMNSLPDKADLSENQEYQALQDKLSKLEMQLGNMDTGEGLKQQLSIRERGIREELDAINRKFAAVDANERAQERIDELKEEQRTVGQQVADQEKKVFLLEKFSRAKIDMLSNAINGQFKVVSFKMYEMQINGGMKDTCEMTVDGVPYSSLNSAAKMQAGLDVISALSRLYDACAPVWLDNRESVTDIPEGDGQTINLYVSKADKELRVEVA